MAAVFGSDWIVVAPWLAFGAGLIFFYISLRRSAHPHGSPARRFRTRPHSRDKHDVLPGPRKSREEQPADPDRHETTSP
jgi:hypothetical protein